MNLDKNQHVTMLTCKSRVAGGSLLSLKNYKVQQLGEKEMR